MSKMRGTCTRLSIVIILMMCVIGCERQRGALSKEEIVEKDGTQIRTQLYEIPYYKSERQIVYWCKNKNTLQIKSSKEGVSRYRMHMPDDGWQMFTVSGAGDSNNKEQVLNRAPTEKIHIVDENFIYIDVSGLMVIVTFDGCKSIIQVPQHNYYSDGNDERIKLFKYEELVIFQSQNSEGLKPPFVTSYIRQTMKGVEQVCFNINPVYIKEASHSFQVCTEDKGTSWYATRKIGDGKVMKRLAGSEEWVAL